MFFNRNPNYKLLKLYSKAKRWVPAYSRALRYIRVVVLAFFIYDSNWIYWYCFASHRFVWSSEMRDWQELHDWSERTSALRCMHGRLSECDESIGACLWRWRTNVCQSLSPGASDLHQGQSYPDVLSRSLPRYWDNFLHYWTSWRPIYNLYRPKLIDNGFCFRILVEDIATKQSQNNVGKGGGSYKVGACIELTHVPTISGLLYHRYIEELNS